MSIKYLKLKIGTNLIKNLFSLAKKNLLAGIAIFLPLSFQALEFYKKLGFEIEFVRDKFKENIKEYYFVGT